MKSNFVIGSFTPENDKLKKNTDYFNNGNEI